MGSEWYANINEQTIGPTTFEELIRRIYTEDLNKDDLIWRPGFSAWKKAYEIPGLFTPPIINNTSEFRSDKEENRNEPLPQLANNQTEPLMKVGQESLRSNPFARELRPIPFEPKVQETNKQPTSQTGVAQGGSRSNPFARELAEGWPKPDPFAREIRRVNASEPSSDNRIDYIKQHWSGELPLGVSYWINGVIVSLVGGFIGALSSTYFGSNYAPKLSLAWMIIYPPIVIAISIWQLVGICRSANNHVSATGRRFWATAARVFLVLGLLQAAMQIVNLVSVYINVANAH